MMSACQFEQCVQPGICYQENRSATAAITAAGPAFGDKLLAMKCEAPIAPLPAADMHGYLVHE